MRIIALSTIKNFWADHPDSEEPLKAWYAITREADWQTPQDVKKAYGNASILQDGRVIFNIADNKYRLVAWINYPYRVLYIKGTSKNLFPAMSGKEGGRTQR